MKRSVLCGFSGVVGVLGWLGSAAWAAEAGGGKQPAATDPLAVKVEAALQLPVGTQINSQQMAAVEVVREHYRPLLRDAITKFENEHRSGKYKRQAERDLADLKTQAANDAQSVLNSLSAPSSVTEVVVTGGTTVAPAAPDVVFFYGHDGHLYVRSHGIPLLARHYLAHRGDVVDPNNVKPGNVKPTGTTKPGGSVPTTVKPTPRPVAPAPTTLNNQDNQKKKTTR